ncbi:MAG: DUF177 domain-containing protein [Kiritimatiellae bacterium]|nr:DUF177 domain-containing protein [Kiritimatiellia bacterium]
MKRKNENRIVIETSQLARAPMEVSGEVDGDAVFNLGNDPVARPAGPIKYALRAELVGGGEVVVTGSAEAPFELLCGRCARFFSTNAKIGAFLRAYAWEDHPEAIDATADVREDLLLELPGYPLCAPDCKGLCPECGNNLNEGPCGCHAPEQPVAETPWAALDGWTEDGGNGVRK